jgi:formylglycine-generating enzyme required for sulfatase activity/energy-coupling factor transporter ATP-binding protein EcfA2
MDLITWLTIGGLVIALVGVYIHWKSEAIKRKEKKAKREAKKVLEKQYQEVLRRQLSRIGVVGPGFETISTRISETFTSLRISEARSAEEGYFSPEEVMERAFQKYRLLLIIGDPGSGKTTLLKYYAVTCLDKKQKILGFKEKEILPIFFPLRELKFKDNHPIPLQDNLAAWSEKCHLKIASDEFHFWLQDRETLVLLDGLDEISDTEKRQQVCQWVENAWSGLGKARFVLTSRPTGYRKIEGLELECEHMRGDIMDFNPEQQELFLNRWFRAFFLDELPEGADPNEIERMDLEAKDRARAIIDFLNREDNKGVRELARVPMLLQIMAIIWKNREYLPGSRSELYEISLNYLLDYRDRRRNLTPLLPAGKARLVLAPTALWMQEKLRQDNAPQQDIHDFMEPILKTLDQPPEVQIFCKNLRDRAGLIADYGEGHYIFRHKSFMEFLAGLQLVKESLAKARRAEILVRYFGDPWWEESLRFFISKSDDTIFDRFIHRFFQSDKSRHLDANQQNLLQNLVKDAPQKKIEGLVKCLSGKDVNDYQKRYILDCLKTIRSPEAIHAVEDFIKNSKDDEANLGHARDIVSELSVEVDVEYVPKMEKVVEETFALTLPDSFRNLFEDNVEYIKIPGGTYTFSVSQTMETVPDLYFCKYPVTNKRYRRFISYLEGNQTQLEHTLPLEMFTERLLEFAKTIKGYQDYLDKDSSKWQKKLRSRYDDEKSFKGEDQPVVGVSWYDARAYCFWLSCLHWQAVAMAKKVKKPPDPVQLASLFRLPTEVEWEWAAAGREPDGSLREYPWAKSKGEPNPSLANYDGNVGTTTPVGRYPDGATPEGLMDMAGNVWEWMGNSHEKYKDSFTLRGGSWIYYDYYLRCAARLYFHPGYRYNYVGFRVLRSQSGKLEL